MRQTGIYIYIYIYVGGLAYCRYQPDSEGVYPLSTSARPGRLFCF